MRIATVLFSCALVFTNLMAQAVQGKVPMPPRAIAVRPAPQQPGALETRVALVIGNGAYTDAPLRNPVSDAQAMKAALESCRFEVTLLIDASKRQMEDAIRAFGDRIRGGAVGLFYFAGHGIQVEGSNFLIPVGARLDKESDVTYEGVDVGRVLDNMKAAGNKLNILILDACRNNPFALAKGWRSVGDKGLAQVKAPTGSLISYATAPGSTAADGTWEHGLYTEALLEEIKEPGLKLEEVFKRVRERVLDGSKAGQTPWESNSTVGDFYFRPLVTDLSGPSEAQLEATWWEGIEASRDPGDFETYLARWPKGTHAELAQLKLKALRARPASGLPADDARPGKALERGRLETADEFARRVAALAPLKVGTVTVDLDRYDVDTRRFVLPVQAETWARSWQFPGRVVLDRDRAQAKRLAEAGPQAALTCRFEVRQGRPVATGLAVCTQAEVLVVGEEPPPIPGAVRNASGQWEATFRVGPAAFTMVLIPAGTFRMGTEAADVAEFARCRPVHDVTISRDFWLGKHPVTQAQWRAVTGVNPSRFLKVGPEAPVDSVSWDDCRQFIASLDGAGAGPFRFPTEAEWEYACRAGTLGERYDFLDTIAWTRDTSGGTTHPVGQRLPNAFGLYDMNGNVWQWCQDWLTDGYPAGASTDPMGPTTGEKRVWRGGCWGSAPIWVRSAYRDGSLPGARDNGYGLRLARTQP